MASHHPIRKSVAPDPPVIPDKLYFRIGDVAAICGVAAYVLRFWETEFPQLKPHKGGTGQRLYRKRDVEMALRIKSLLYDQGYTIPGARQVFKSESHHDNADMGAHSAAPPQGGPLPSTVDFGEAIRQDAPYREKLAAIRAELLSLRQLLLSAPMGDAPVPGAEPAPVRLKLMRPRMVSEGKLESRTASRPTNQGDLFPVE